METLEEELPTILATTVDSFGRTRWSLVLGAQEGSENALNELIGLYRKPIVGHLVRHLGVNDGEDAAQEYLRGLLESGYLRKASEKRGKFRAFLLHDLRYFILGWWRYRSAKKRGGGAQHCSYEEMIRLGMELPQDEVDWNEEYFDEEWTACVMANARKQLSEIYAQRNQSRRFELLEQFIEFGGDMERYERVAPELGMKATAVKEAVHRLRKAFAHVLRDLVEQAVSEGESVEEELEYLKRCFLKSVRVPKE